MRRVHGWRRPVRWARNIVLGVVGLVTVVVAGAYVFFETRTGKELLRKQIESRLSAAMSGGATVGGVEGNPLSDLVLKDLVINGPDKRPAITVKRLTIKLPLMPLLSHQLRVETIVADEVDVTIGRLADGRINVASLTRPSKASTWSVKLPNVEVHRGHVEISLGAEPVDLDNLELRVDAALPYAGPIDAALSLSARWRQKQAPLDLAASVHVDSEVALIRHAIAQLGDIDLSITALSIARTPHATPVGGVVSLYAPARTIHTLAPAVALPGDVVLLLTARPDGRLSHVVLDGALGASRVNAFADVDLQARLARGIVIADALDVTALSEGTLAGHGGGVVAFDVDGNDLAADLPSMHAMITAWGEVGRAPPMRAVIAVSSEGARTSTVIGATSASGLHARGDAAILVQGGRLTLERGTIVATTADAMRATRGLAPLRGSLDVNLHASGALAPQVDLEIRGHANGRRLHFMDIAAAAFELRVDATHVPRNPTGSARLEIADLRRGDMELGKLTLAAGNRPDGKVQVSVRSKPKRAPWLIDLDALVTMGDTVVVDLQRHVVRAAGGTVWRGDRGTLTVNRREVVLRDFSTRSDAGRVAADATFVRAGRHVGDLTAKVDANVSLGNIDRTYRGKVDAHVDVSRIGGRLAGSIVGKATGVALDPTSPLKLDGEVNIQATPGKLIADVDVGATDVGHATITVDVDAPTHLTDMRAWRRLERDSINSAQLKLAGIDLQRLATLAGARPMAGRLDGDITLTRTTAGGLVRIRGLRTVPSKELGTIDADVRIGQAGKDELRTTVKARLQPTAAAVSADARFRPPDRLFDPAAWHRLGADAFRGGSLRVEGLAFHPGTLERLGIASDMCGEIAIGAELDEGMRAARLAVTIHDLRGGLLAQPIGATVSAVLDDTSSRVTASVVAQNVTVLRVTGGSPVTLAELRANPRAATTAPLRAIAVIDRVPVQTLMAVLGTSQVRTGVLDGTIEIAGNVRKPTLAARLAARDVTIPEGARTTQSIKLLTIDASWDGEAGKLVVDGQETAGGTLALRVAGNPDDLAAVTLSLTASKLDLAPLVAFLPGPAEGLGGRMDASFTLAGADPRTAQLAGNLRITGARIPIAPAVGTLFDSDVKLAVRNRTIGLDVVGKLGRGDIKLVASAPLQGLTPTTGKLALTLREVQLIGKTEPILTGAVTADVARVDGIWRANLRVDRMNIKVPAAKGRKLDPVGAPNDVVYGGLERHHGIAQRTDVPRAAGAPVADVKLVIRNVSVESKDVRGLVGGNLDVAFYAKKEATIIGHIGVTRGVLELFSRRYQVDRANLQFDGSPDPLLDVRIVHEFPEATTITEVRGRMSKPKLFLSSQPAQYSEAELLGFLLGGVPGGNHENAPSATSRVESTGASLIGNRVGGYVKKALPVDIDVLRYESASSTSSAVVTVGTWITDSLFLAYRQHLEAHPDENTGEGQVEYWIKSRLVLEAVIGDRGVNGMDLLWRKRW